jgi:hypothetical protein
MNLEKLPSFTNIVAPLFRTDELPGFKRVTSGSIKGLPKDGFDELAVAVSSVLKGWKRPAAKLLMFGALTPFVNVGVKEAILEYIEAQKTNDDAKTQVSLKKQKRQKSNSNVITQEYCSDVNKPLIFKDSSYVNKLNVELQEAEKFAINAQKAASNSAFNMIAMTGMHVGMFTSMIAAANEFIQHTPLANKASHHLHHGFSEASEAIFLTSQLAMAYHGAKKAYDKYQEYQDVLKEQPNAQDNAFIQEKLEIIKQDGIHGAAMALSEIGMVASSVMGSTTGTVICAIGTMLASQLKPEHDHEHSKVISNHDIIKSISDSFKHPITDMAEWISQFKPTGKGYKAGHACQKSMFHGMFSETLNKQEIQDTINELKTKIENLNDLKSDNKEKNLEAIAEKIKDFKQFVEDNLEIISTVLLKSDNKEKNFEQYKDFIDTSNPEGIEVQLPDTLLLLKKHNNHKFKEVFTNEDFLLNIKDLIVENKQEILEKIIDYNNKNLIKKYQQLAFLEKVEANNPQEEKK